MGLFKEIGEEHAERAREEGIAEGRRLERERIIAMARAHNYGPTLRTFVKWVARGAHEETP